MWSSQTVDKLDDNRVCLFFQLLQECCPDSCMRKGAADQLSKAPVCSIRKAKLHQESLPLISITAAIDFIDWVLYPPIFTETGMIDKTGILINLF